MGCSLIKIDGMLCSFRGESLDLYLDMHLFAAKA